MYNPTDDKNNAQLFFQNTINSTTVTRSPSKTLIQLIASFLATLAKL